MGTCMNDRRVRCELTGEPLFVRYTGDPNVPFADRPHFNLAAFRMPHPTGRRQLRQHARSESCATRRWHEWDITLSRRFPITLAGRRNSGIKIQLQAYNVFNEMQFTNMNAAFTFTGPNNSLINSANTGKYMATGHRSGRRDDRSARVGSDGEGGLVGASADWRGPGVNGFRALFSYHVKSQIPNPKSQGKPLEAVG